MASHRKKKDIPETAKARRVLGQTRDSVAGFHNAFETVRRARHAKGNPTDQEQDLLRAALVFAAAGLDSVAKELIKECLTPLAACDDDVRKGLETFVQRQLRGDGDDPDAVGGSKFLAKVLISETPHQSLLEQYVLELTGSSLQSADQLMKACGALGLQPNSVGIDPRDLRPIFSARNKIIHELDVNLERTAARRSQNSRRRPDMERWSTRLLDIAENLTAGVEEKLLDAN